MILSPVKERGRNFIENYRPMVILSNFIKVVEKVIHVSIYAHVKYHIADNQHVYIKCISTATNLLLMTHYMSVALNEFAQVDIVYTNFSKAFDSLDHGILLENLLMFGMILNFVNFIESYLNDGTL